MIDWTYVEESTQQLQALLDRVKEAARKANIDATTQAFNKFAIAPVTKHRDVLAELTATRPTKRTKDRRAALHDTLARNALPKAENRSDVLPSLARVLGVRLDWLLEGVGPIERAQ